MSSIEIRNLLGLKDNEKRVYFIDSSQVSQEEFEFCVVLNNILWGDKGMTQTLGPTWNMIMDPRFESLERFFIVERKTVFGGDARLGKQYIDGSSALSGSMAELETYSEILGEGRYFHGVVSAAGLDPKTFCSQPEGVIWKFIRQECPNYFDNKNSIPNARAQRLAYLFRADLLGLIDDFAEVALLQEWIRLDTGERADPNDKTDIEINPIVYAEVDMLERALTFRASLKVTAAKILEKSGLMEHLEKNYQITDWEIDSILKIIYSTPYDKLYTVTMNVMEYVRIQCQVPFEKRLAKELSILSTASKVTISLLKDGSLKPLSITEEEEIGRELTHEEKQIVAIQRNPHRLELFTMFVEAESNNDQASMALIQPYLDDIDNEVTEANVTMVKDATRYNRTSSSVKSILGM